MKILKRVALCIVIGLLCSLGIGCCIFPGYSFSGYLCFGVVGLILVFLLLKLLSRRRPKTARVLRLILILGLCAGLVLATVTGCFIASAWDGSDGDAGQYVIVLGAGVNGTTPSLILSERIGRAYDYLTENPDTICIVSGGQGPGEDITEAQCMLDQLTGRGIDPERIWLEDKSTSTRENIRFSLDVIEEKTGIRPTVAAVISNEFHLFRAGLVAGEQQLQAVGVPAHTTWFSLQANYFLREIVAVWFYVLFGD